MPDRARLTTAIDAAREKITERDLGAFSADYMRRQVNDYLATGRAFAAGKLSEPEFLTLFNQNYHDIRSSRLCLQEDRQ